MGKHKFAAILLILQLLILLPGICNAVDTYYLKKEFGDFSTWKEAIDFIEDNRVTLGDDITLIVERGRYQETIAPKKLTCNLNTHDLTIKSEDAHLYGTGVDTNVTIETRYPSATDEVLYVNVLGNGNVIVEGINFVVAGSTHPTTYIVLDPNGVSPIITMRKCAVKGGGAGAGISIGDGRNKVYNNFVYDFATGIYIASDQVSGDFFVASNTVVDCTSSGIGASAEAVKLINNYVNSGGTWDFSGLSLAHGYHNMCEDTTCEDSDFGGEHGSSPETPLNPEADTIVTDIYNLQAGTDHYAMINAANDATYVYSLTSNSTALHWDYYDIPNHSGTYTDFTITGVTVHARVAGYDFDGDTYLPACGEAYISIAPGDGNRDGTYKGDAITLTKEYGNHSEEWATNPFDSSAWEWSDIAALEVGAGLDLPAAGGDIVNCLGLVTRVYAEVSFNDAYGNDASETLAFTSASDDEFLISADDISAVVDGGTSMSSFFTTDAFDTTRSGTWDVGAEEYETKPTKDYFISSLDGDNENDGLTSGTEWEDFESLDDTHINYQDSVNLERGSILEDTLWLTVMGRTGNTVTIQTYDGDYTGSPDAKIDGNGNIPFGIVATGSHFEILNMIVDNCTSSNVNIKGASDVLLQYIVGNGGTNEGEVIRGSGVYDLTIDNTTVVNRQNDTVWSGDPPFSCDLPDCPEPVLWVRGCGIDLHDVDGLVLTNFTAENDSAWYADFMDITPIPWDVPLEGAVRMQDCTGLIQIGNDGENSSIKYWQTAILSENEIEDAHADSYIDGVTMEYAIVQVHQCGAFPSVKTIKNCEMNYSLVYPLVISVDDGSGNGCIIESNNCHDSGVKRGVDEMYGGGGLTAANPGGPPVIFRYNYVLDTYSPNATRMKHPDGLGDLDGLDFSTDGSDSYKTLGGTVEWFDMSSDEETYVGNTGGASGVMQYSLYDIHDPVGTEYIWETRHSGNLTSMKVRAKCKTEADYSTTNPPQVELIVLMDSDENETGTAQDLTDEWVWYEEEWDTIDGTTPHFDNNWPDIQVGLGLSQGDEGKNAICSELYAQGLYASVDAYGIHCGMNDSLIHDNIVFYCRGNGIMIWDHVSYGFDITGVGIYNNLFYNDGNAGIFLHNATGCTVKNNIVLETVETVTRLITVMNTDGMVIDNNTYWNPNEETGTTMFMWGDGENSTIGNWVDWENTNEGYPGFDSNGQFADPKISDLAGNVFQLLSTSPCIDTGADLSAIIIPYLDFWGTTRPIDGNAEIEGAIPDIGPHEYYAGWVWGEEFPDEGVPDGWDAWIGDHDIEGDKWGQMQLESTDETVGPVNDLGEAAVRFLTISIDAFGEAGSGTPGNTCWRGSAGASFLYDAPSSPEWQLYPSNGANRSWRYIQLKLTGSTGQSCTE